VLGGYQHPTAQSELSLDGRIDTPALCQACHVIKDSNLRDALRHVVIERKGYYGTLHSIERQLMASVTLIKAAKLKDLVANFSHQIFEGKPDPFQITSVIFPNQHLKNVITWEALSSHEDERQTKERCLAGVNKYFTAEFIKKVCDCLALPELPSSEELAWGLLSRRIASDEAITSNQLSDAHQISEALFRLPTNVPSALIAKDLDIHLPNSLKNPSSESDDKLTVPRLWRALIEQRSNLKDSLDQVNLIAPIEGELLKLDQFEEPSGSTSKTIKRFIGDIHLVAPKSLSVLLLRLLNVLSKHVNVYLYMLTADPAQSVSFASTEAFNRNLKAIQELCPPVMSEGNSTSSETNSNSGPDPSVSLYRCTHDARQVEMLHEQLRSLLLKKENQEPSELTQRDMLVLVSDMKRFLPYIEQNFFIGPYQSKNLLCGVIIDRGLEEANPYELLIQSLSRIFTRRLSLQAVLDLFSLSPVKERFGMSDGHVARIKSLLEKVNLKWGIDAKDRERLTQVRSSLHTWRYAIERLLLSELMDPLDQPHAPYLNVNLPSEAMGGTDYELIGRFLSFYQTFEQLIAQHPAPPTQDIHQPGAPYLQWKEWLLMALKELTPLYQSDQVERLRGYMVRQAILQVEQDISASRPEALAQLSLTTGAVLKAIGSALKSYRSIRGKSGAGITFAPISIGAGTPAKVVAFLGMEEGTFPKALQLGLNDPLNPRHPTRISGSTERWVSEAELSPSRVDSEWASFLSACENTEQHIMAFWTGSPRFHHEEAVEPCGPVRYLIERYKKLESADKQVKYKYWVDVPISKYAPALFQEQASLISEKAEDQPLKQSYPIQSTSQVAYEAAQILADPNREAIEPTFPLSGRTPNAIVRTAPELITLNQFAKSISDPMNTFLRLAGHQLTAHQEEQSHQIPLEMNKLQEWSVNMDLLDQLMTLSHQHLTEELDELELSSKISADLPRLYQDQYASLRAKGLIAPGAQGRSIFTERWRHMLHYFWKHYRLISKQHHARPVKNTVILDYSKRYNLKIAIPISMYLSKDSSEPHLFSDYTTSKIPNRPSKYLSVWVKYLALHTDDQNLLNLPSDLSSQITGTERFEIIGLDQGFDYIALDPTHPQAKEDKLMRRRLDMTSQPEHIYKTIDEVCDHYRRVKSGDRGLLAWDFSLCEEMMKGQSSSVIEVIENRLESTFQPYKSNQEMINMQSSFLFGTDETFSDINDNLTEDFSRCLKFASTINDLFK